MITVKGVWVMSNRCQRCSSQLEVKKTSLQSGVGNLTVMIEGITLYVCPRCGETVMESSDAFILRKINESVGNEEEIDFLQSAFLPDILTLPEVAALLRVSHQTIYNMIRDGRIKGYKVGREWRFLKKEIDLYMMVEH